MSILKMNDPREMKIIPVHHIRIGTSGDIIYLYNLEEGSQWSLLPVLRQNDRGGNRVVAWKFEGTFIVVQNNYEDFNGIFTTILNYPVADFDLFLMPGYAVPWDESAEYSEQEQHGIVQVSYDSGSSKVKQWHASFGISQSKENPRLTVTVSGLFSSDMFDSGTIWGALS